MEYEDSKLVPSHDRVLLVEPGVVSKEGSIGGLVGVQHLGRKN